MELNQPFGLFRPALIRLSYPTRAIADCRFSIADLNNRQLAFGNAVTRSTKRQQHRFLNQTGPTMPIGRGGQNRTVTTSSQDSDACVTPHPEELVRQVRLELTIPCLRGRCLDPIWLLTHGGTERTRTVIGLIDNQVPHLSATVPSEKIGSACRI